jgi:hydroxyacylglutathione hydrolase
MIFEQIPTGPIENFSYVVADEDTKQAAVIDPNDARKILDVLQKKKLKLEYIINTHTHFDHIGANKELKKSTGAQVVMHNSAKEDKDVAVKDGDIIKIGKIRMEVIHTPGHTEDGICLLVEDKLITGDTLFVGSYGRTDLAGGSMEKLRGSIKKLMRLNSDIEIYPGHDYGDKTHSTIKDERRLYKAGEV